jgi:hypothetical protein
MATRLDKTLKREIEVGGQAYIVAISPAGLKLTLKGKRNGAELGWADLISGDAALAAALNASVGRLEPSAAHARRLRPAPTPVPTPARGATAALTAAPAASKRRSARSRRKRR